MSFFFFFRRIYITNLLNCWHPQFRDLHIFFLASLASPGNSFSICSLYIWDANDFSSMCALKLLQRNNISSWIALLLLLSTASSHFHFSDDRSLLEVPVGEWVHGSCGPEVNESHFFNFETRMRISPIQSPTLRGDENFLTLDLRLQDEIEKNSSSI